MSKKKLIPKAQLGILTKAKNAKEALEIVKQMKAAKAAKAKKLIPKSKQVLEPAQIVVSDIKDPVEWYNSLDLMKPSRINIDNLLNRVSEQEKIEILKVMQQNPDKYFAGDYNGFIITPQRAASKIRNIRKSLLGKDYTSLTGPTAQIRQNVGIQHLPQQTDLRKSDYIITKRGGKTWDTTKRIKNEE